MSGTQSLQMVVKSNVFNPVSTNSLWELLAKDCKSIFSNAYGEADPYYRTTCGTCVCRGKGKQLSLAATLELFSAVSIRKILATP